MKKLLCLALILALALIPRLLMPVESHDAPPDLDENDMHQG